MGGIIQGYVRNDLLSDSKLFLGLYHPRCQISLILFKKGPSVLKPIFHVGSNMKGAVVKRMARRKQLKRMSYTLQAAEHP